MKRVQIKLDTAQELLVEQSLKLTPSERFQYALGMLEFALRINPQLKENRERLLNLQSRRKESRRR